MLFAVPVVMMVMVMSIMVMMMMVTMTVMAVVVTVKKEICQRNQYPDCNGNHLFLIKLVVISRSGFKENRR